MWKAIEAKRDLGLRFGPTLVLSTWEKLAMPVLMNESLTRNTFLRLAAAGIAGCIIRPLSVLADSNVASEPWRVALFSDTHIAADPNESYRKFLIAKNLQQVVAEIGEKRLKAAILAGDAARLDGKAGDYEHLARLLSPLSSTIPVVIALGNHDDRAVFRESGIVGKGGELLFAESLLQGVEAKASGRTDKQIVVIRNGDLQFVVLDSLMEVNKTPGYLGKAQRNWLAEYLKTTPDVATFVVVHHTLGDEDGELLDVERLFSVIEPAKQVKAVIFGHSHTYRFAERSGIHLINLPGVGYNFADTEPVGWVEAEFQPTQGQFTLHAVGGNPARDGEQISLNWR